MRIFYGYYTFDIISTKLTFSIKAPFINACMVDNAHGLLKTLVLSFFKVGAYQRPGALLEVLQNILFETQ